jgi:hypothetical protein
MTPQLTEPTTFRFVTQSLNELRHCVPHCCIRSYMKRQHFRNKNSERVVDHRSVVRLPNCSTSGSTPEPQDTQRCAVRQSYLVWVGTSFNSRNENFRWNSDKIEMAENGERPRYTPYQSTAEKTHQQDT